MAYYRRRPTFLNDGQIPANPDAPLSDTAWYFYGQVTSDPVNEAFIAGKNAARKERAAKATDANMNRPELRALPPAIVAVCARHKPPLKPAASETFAELIRAAVRHEVYATVDSKTKKRLLSRKPKWPWAPVIKGAIRVMRKNLG
jgi:hypothetical protein